MAISTTDSLFEALDKSGLLDAQQLAQARELAPQVADARALAKKLVAMGWLTRWQSDLLLAGRTSFFLGKYKLMELLGRGGMGNVYLARHTMMNRPVALKIISKQLGRDPANLERFFSEARAVAALNHPNIVHAYNIDNEGDRYYMVMEFVEGKDLQRMVEENGPLDCALAAEYIRQAADGLAHAHDRNIVHCDIKPANLLVNPQGVVKILDMGMARLVSTEVENGAAYEEVLGTVDYMAPELAVQSPRVDRRADIYSLGCTLYFLLTGHPPFPEGSLAERILKHQMEQPRPILEQRPNAPRDLVEICERMIAKKPEDRFQSADEVVTRLADRGLTEDLSLQPLPLDEQRTVPSPSPPPAERPSSAGQTTDLFDQADESFPAGGLAFSEEALPPAESVISPSSSSARRYSKDRQPVLIFAGVAGVVLVGLIATLVFLIGSPDSGSHTAQDRSPQDRANPDNGTPVVPTTQSVSSGAQKAGSQVAPPVVKVPAPAPQSPSPSKRRSLLGAPTLTQKSPPTPSTATPMPFGKIAQKPGPEPPKSATPPKPPIDGVAPTKPARTSSPAEVKAPAIADPFAALPPLVDLPLLSETEGLTQPFPLGNIEMRPEIDWQIELLGGDKVLAGGNKYVLHRNASQPAIATWTIRLERPVVGASALGSDVAKLWRADGSSLMFQWAPDVRPKDGNYLRNCILRLRVQDTVRHLGLLSPTPISPLTLGAHHSRSSFELQWVPPLGDVKIQITKADGPSAYKLDPAEPVGFDTPVRLTYLWKDRTGRDTLGVVFTFKSMFRPREGKYLAYLTLQTPESALQEPYLTMLRRFEAHLPRFGNSEPSAVRRPNVTEQADATRKQLAERADTARKQIVGEQARIEKQLKDVVNEDQRKQLDGQLREFDARLWYVDFYQAVQAKAFVHFRIFVQVEDQQVVLASTEVPRPGEHREDDTAQQPAPGG